MTTAVDKIERMHYRRRSSFIQEQRRERRETMEPLEEVEVDVVDVPKRKTPRYKSTSVCLAMVSMKSDRTDVVDFPHPTTHRCGGTSRFVVERSSILDTLDPKDLPSVRLRGLSTSEVFHEPPSMYVYRERPPISFSGSKSTRQDGLLEYVRERKHTICAWTFGIAVAILMTTIITLQIKGDFS